MNLRRVVLGTAGIVLVAAVLLAGSSVGSLLPVGSAVDALGNDYYLLAALGGVVLLLALAAFQHGRGVDQLEMPDPEQSVSVPTPGDELAETLDGWRLAVPFLGRETRRDVEARLRSTAVEVVRRAENCTTSEARERVATGAWTDDPDAAAFLASDRRTPSLGAYVRALAGGDTRFAHGARRTADEIASLGRVEPGPGSSESTAEPASGPSADPVGPGADDRSERRVAG